MPERVQKLISQWGIASRRQAETMILEGRVRLNGQVVHLGQKADPAEGDRLEVDGQLLHPQNRPQFVYLLLNKPKGVLCTCDDPQKRKTVLDLLPPRLGRNQGIHPVGRLDGDSTGAVLLTNDGDLTLRLTHPRYHLPKTYQVWVQGCPSATTLKQWRGGVLLADQWTLPAEINVLASYPQRTLLEIVLREGRNRQIRRVAEQLGHRVLELHRTAIGTLQLADPQQPDLPIGHYRSLTEQEIWGQFATLSL
ncbi:rRNA pseudouridine synthase [Spirulina subsalsa FACHB-351]|uniref:Pseudouridine synthase n=1 Tax=Spirulina subsalsa FACHB-351 TaxID=234711 RepID=A0ABT3L986_9CYAN|nr:pseudouridine synthase [Spirulina subsalsa]MCW6037525.1 rRNA pseudouridine synthase [Spirulina subsalsa FACHB-351]